LSDTVYIVLFRGVGGATQLPVRPLREALTRTGFGNVSTYINSGNALLTTSMRRGEMLKKVADICRSEFGFDKPIHARTRAEWSKLIEQNPFPDAVAIPKFLHAAVLEAKPEQGRLEALREFASKGERIEVVGEVAYINTPEGFGRSKLAERFDKGIGVGNTARNWNTVLKLGEMAASIAAR
jgi:uncharacterized protein (DUF1697 family)